MVNAIAVPRQSAALFDFYQNGGARPRRRYGGLKKAFFLRLDWLGFGRIHPGSRVLIRLCQVRAWRRLATGGMKMFCALD